jgi:IclR family transcriptional regulator, pca regulon regulatory protein
MVQTRKTAARKPPGGNGPPKDEDPLLVQSVAKAFRVLEGFDPAHPTLSLTQLAARIELDMSATQRFAHTLVKLGYLYKNPSTKRFELTARTLNVGYYYVRSNPLVQRAMPYLLSLSKETQATVNLTVLDNTEIVFVARFMGPQVLNTNTFVGSRMPAYCTASGIAMLSKMPRKEAIALLQRSDLRSYTPRTTASMDKLLEKLDVAGERGYGTAFEEYYPGDLSVASAIVSPAGTPIGAVNVAVSKAHYTAREAEQKFASLVVATALSILP